MLRTGLWVSAALTTLVAFQALWTRQRIPRLLAARGQHCGCLVNTGSALNLLVIGESSVAGVGVENLRDGLAAQMAHELHRRIDRTVNWHAIGRPGATVRAIHSHVLDTTVGSPLAEFQADIVVFALGANDSLRMRWPLRWHEDVERLLHSVRHRHPCQLIVLSPVPPLWQFSSLPRPLRMVLGAQAFVLDRMLRRIARAHPSVLYVPVRLAQQRCLLAADGFHPSRAGYRSWAMQLAFAILTAPRPAASLLAVGGSASRAH